MRWVGGFGGVGGGKGGGDGDDVGVEGAWAGGWARDLKGGEDLGDTCRERVTVYTVTSFCRTCVHISTIEKYTSSATLNHSDL